MNQHVQFEQGKVQKLLSTGNWQNWQPLFKKNSKKKKKKSTCLSLLLLHVTKGRVGHAKAKLNWSPAGELYGTTQHLEEAWLESGLFLKFHDSTSLYHITWLGQKHSEPLKALYQFPKTFLWSCLILKASKDCEPQEYYHLAPAPWHWRPSERSSFALEKTAI